MDESGISFAGDETASGGRGLVSSALNFAVASVGWKLSSSSGRQNAVIKYVFNRLNIEHFNTVLKLLNQFFKC